ncbi:MAG: TPR end-of-group domain-containing protein [Bryobacteraceae bacterium]
MPSRPNWLQRLPEIIQRVELLSAETIDRKTFESIFQVRRRRAIELMHVLGSYAGRRGFVLDRSALLERLGSFETTVQYRWEQQTRSPGAAEPAEPELAHAVSAPNDLRNGGRRVVIDSLDDDELMERLLASVRAVVDGRREPIAPQDPRVRPKPQYDRFDQAVHAFRRHGFTEARSLFAQACAGPDKRIRASAEEYIRICNRCLEETPEPRSFEEHYTYGVALLNLRELPEARKHFESARNMNPRADYVYYALAACSALSREISGIYSNLNRAIELEPRNRMAARHDPDFEAVLEDPMVARLLGVSARESSASGGAAHDQG